MKQGRGWSLIELLVVVVICAILIGLSFPVVSAVRKHARTTGCRSNLRQHAISVIGYCGSEREYFPYPFPKDRAPVYMDKYPGMELHGAAPGRWFKPLEYGKFALTSSLVCPQDQYMRAAATDPAISAAMKQHGDSSYSASYALYVSPEALGEAPILPIPFAHYATQKIGDVAFPSQKSMLHESDPFHDPKFAADHAYFSPRKQMVVAVDGAVYLANTANVLPAVLIQPVRRPEMTELMTDMSKFITTLHGVRGMDWKSDPEK